VFLALSSCAERCILRSIRALLLSALLFACFGCHATSERFIVGTYRAEATCVTITLVLNQDHSFVQSVRATSGETKQLTGKWSMDQWNTGQQMVKTVDFDSFLDFSEDEHGRQGGSARDRLSPRAMATRSPDGAHNCEMSGLEL
jgi:hypothetical protein